MSLLTRKTAATLVFILAASIILSACNFPGMGPTQDLNATSAAQTVAARLSQEPGPGDEGTTAPEPPQIATTEAPPTEEPPTPTATLTPTITKTTVPCDRAAFVTDVTIPDGEELQPNESFTKTWRLKNDGSCTWTSSYALIFDSGDSMGGPASKQLTSGTVGPGETMDVSVNLTAPSSPGTYKGYWKLRNGSGVNFGIGTGGTNPFWVEIEVVPNTVTISATFVSGESGQVTKSTFISGNRTVGDNAADDSSQAFLSFNISAIPADAVITKVVIDLGTFTDTGSPFAGLGALFIYKDDYGSLDASDYVNSTPSSGRLIAWSSISSLGNPVSDQDMVNALQTKVGSSRFKLRLQFNKETDSDGALDIITFGPPKLEVTYYTP
jgi:predicted small secreted protein